MKKASQHNRIRKRKLRLRKRYRKFTGNKKNHKLKQIKKSLQ